MIAASCILRISPGDSTVWGLDGKAAQKPEAARQSGKEKRDI